MCRCKGLLALALACVVALVQGVEKSEEVLIGWQGETYTPKDGDVLLDAPRGAHKPSRERPWVQVLSWSPRAFVYHNFLSRQEVQHILRLAHPLMKRSMVVGKNDTGVMDDVRTSAGMFLPRNQDRVIAAIEERLALWSHTPVSHQEALQVLRYGPTNKYGAHCDGLGRVMSVLIYLIEPDEGGETAFPQTRTWLHPEMGEPLQGSFSACAKRHVAYKPKTGDALLFHDTLPDYSREDPMAEHTGCPVIRGTKWNAVKWIHGAPFHPEEYERELRKDPDEPGVASDPGLCEDLHDMCAKWAEHGECENNPEYMLGHGDGRGMCRKACRDCEACDRSDAECLRRNRLAGGFLQFDESEFKGLLG